MTTTTHYALDLLDKLEGPAATKATIADHIRQQQNLIARMDNEGAERQVASAARMFQQLRDWGITSVDLRE